MQINQTNIRRTARRYRSWLLDQQWFNCRVKNRKEWLKPINNIIDKKATTPTFLWESVIDHWHATNWNRDNFPTAFEVLYELVDEYRSMNFVDATDNISLLVDCLNSPKNQGAWPQTVISECYENVSGIELFCDTDPDNGEDYQYKHNEGAMVTSLALHQEVSDYFGFKSKYLKLNGISLFLKEMTNQELAELIRNNRIELFV